MTPPDFTDEYEVGVMDYYTIRSYIEASVEKFKALGVRHCRATIAEDQTMLWIEGWKVRPDVETPPPRVQ
jgi:hypothetical protein